MPVGFAEAIGPNRLPIERAVLVGRPECVQKLVRDDDIVGAAITATGVAIHDTDHALLQSNRVLEDYGQIRSVITHENAHVGVDTILVVRCAASPPTHFQRPQHDGQCIGLFVELGWLFIDLAAEFNTYRAP